MRILTSTYILFQKKKQVRIFVASWSKRVNSVHCIMQSTNVKVY